MGSLEVQQLRTYDVAGSGFHSKGGGGQVLPRPRACVNRASGRFVLKVIPWDKIGILAPPPKKKLKVTYSTPRHPVFADGAIISRMKLNGGIKHAC